MYRALYRNLQAPKYISYTYIHTHTHNIKIVNAQQARSVYTFKDIKLKLLKKYILWCTESWLYKLTGAQFATAVVYRQTQNGCEIHH
jgi:hypothetical protein